MLMAAPVWAGGEPSFDCAKAASVAEEAICADPALAALDQRLAERFAAAMEVAGPDAAALRTEQRGWIKGRDDCWKADDIGDCIEEAYLVREGQLVALWLLDEPMSVQAWSCAGNPANEVTAYYFDLERPAMRLEYGDTIDAGTLMRSASGARYAASFGREFWEHGGKATFTWVEGSPMTCVPASQGGLR